MSEDTKTAKTTRFSGRSPRRGSPRRLMGLAAMAISFAAINGQSVAAQVGAPDRAHRSGTIAFTQTRPRGALAGNIRSGYGVVGSFLLPLDRAGLLSLRADLGVAEYGHETNRAPFSESAGGRVEVDVRTSNIVIPGSMGIQLTPSLGPIAPYVNAGVGAQAFFTESSVQSTSGGSALASSVNQSDVALAWTLGGGFYVPLSSGPKNVQLDIGVQYIQGGRARYLAPGSIVDLDGGGIAITPMESTTHILALRFGARIGL